VNAEQSSKSPTQKPTRRGFGEGCYLWCHEQRVARDSAGVMATACVSEGDRGNLGKPHRVVGCDDRPDAREGEAGHNGVAERLVVPTRSV
jgi:hypothetical protein